MGNYSVVASRMTCAAFCLAALCVPANSADLGYPRSGGYKDYGEPIVVPANFFSWTGFYLGGHLGYGWADSASTNRPDRGNGDAFDGLGGMETDPSGWLAGVTGGYNWHVDAFLFGLEGDLGYIGAEDDERNPFGFATAEYGWYGTLTARIGYAQDRFLFYGKGGFAFADIENTAGAISGGAIVLEDYTELSEVKTGWALGAGAEYAFNRNMSVRFEYLYMDFGTDTSTNFDGDVFEHENDIHTVKVGLTYMIPGSIPLF